MIGLLAGERAGQGRDAGSPVHRVRHHLRMLPRKPENLRDENRLRADLRHLVARLSRVHDRGRAFQGVQISDQVQEAMKTLKMVGNELLVLLPQRKGA